MPPKWKIEKVQELTEKFKSAGYLYLADFTGLNVEEANQLRSRFREAGVEYEVCKNTLIGLAAKDSGLDEIQPHLTGPTALVFGADDANVPAKILLESYKRSEKPKVKAFMLDGRMYLTIEDLETVASLPSREELLARLCSMVEAPITGFVATLEGILRQLVATIDAVAARKE